MLFYLNQANRPETDENIQISTTESKDVNIDHLKNLVVNATKYIEFADAKNKYLVGVANEMFHLCMEFIEIEKLKTTKAATDITKT